MSRSKEAGPIQTFTGRMVDTLNFYHDDVQLQDIATSLSRLARFNGHTRDFYSVAQHSAIVALVAADLANPTGCADKAGLALRVARWGLLHDAHEAWLGDVPGPLKPLTEKLNDRAYWIDCAVRETFGMPEQLPEDAQAFVSEADRQVLAREASDLLRHDTGWHKVLKRWERGIIERSLDHDEAKRAFLRMYDELFGLTAQLTNTLLPEQIAALWSVAGVKLVEQIAEGSQ